MAMDRNRLTRFRPLYGLKQNVHDLNSGDVLGELKMLAERYSEQGRMEDAAQMMSLVRSIDPLEN